MNFLKRITDSFKTVPLVSKSNKQSTNQTYDIFDVCAYIIYYYSKHDSLISNLKLQKVLYFLQAYFLVNKHHPLFRNDILFCDWGESVDYALYLIGNLFKTKEEALKKVGAYKEFVKLATPNMSWREDDITYSDTVNIAND